MIFLVIVALIFNGLNNSRELNDLAIVSALGVDINDEGEYEVSAQVLNAKKTENSASGSSSSDDTIITVYESKGSSIQEAVRNVVKECPKKLYSGHLELVIMSEKLARQDEILDTLDFFIRDNEGGNGFMLAIAKDKDASDIVKILTPLKTLPSENILESILTTEKYRGSATKNKLSDYLKLVYAEGKDVTFTSLVLEGDVNDGENEEDLKSTVTKTKILVDDIAYFNGDRMAGYLEGNDNIMYNLLENKVNSAIISCSQGDEMVVAEIIKAKTNMKPKVNDDGTLVVEIKADITCNLTELRENVKLENEGDLKNIETCVSDEIKKEIETYIYNCQNKYNCDIVGLGNLYYKYQNKYYESIKDKFYDDYFKNIKLDVKVNVKIPNEGGVSK